MINNEFNDFIDEVKGELETVSKRVWMGYRRYYNNVVNVAQYKPFHGGSYMLLPKKLQNKKEILTIQNRENQCLRWSLRAHLFPAPRGKNPIRPSSYPTEDSLNFTGINFPTPVSQIDKLEMQNPNLAINVFGWEKDHAIVHRISEKGSDVERINLMIIQEGGNTHYTM